MCVREWRFDPETARCSSRTSSRCSRERTRLVAFTHCSNVVGTIHDAAAIVAPRARRRGLVCVDGVAFAPHRRVDVQALGADFYLVSLYKVYGPHLALLYGARALRARAGRTTSSSARTRCPTSSSPAASRTSWPPALPGILEYLAPCAAWPAPAA